MLLKLPYEITLIIIGQLEFKDKINLKTTCHKVNDLISNTVLYEDLDLLHPKYRPEYTYGRRPSHSSPTYTSETIKKLLNEKFDGSHVQILRIYTMDLSDHELSQLSDLFPNIKRIITTNKTRNGIWFLSGFPRIKLENTTYPLVKWRNTIQKIDSRYDWKAVLIDMLCSKYPRLTELDLLCDRDFLTHCTTYYNLSLFKNAPSLTTLTLRDANIDLNILEAIHTGFPLLQSLSLFKPCIILEEDAALLSSVVPAKTMSYLGFSKSRYFNKNRAILDYIVKKYPNLQQLHYGVFHVADYTLKRSDQICTDLVQTRDKDAQLDFKRLCSTIETLHQDGQNLLYSVIESNFFSDLPQSLKTLTLEVNNMANAVTALSASDAKITTLNLLDYKREYDKEWKEPNIFEPLKTITSLQTLKIKLRSSVQTFNSEFISLTITRLFITLSGDSFAIEWVLSMFPNLEELDITPSKYMTDDISDYVIRGQRHNNNNEDSTEIQSRKVYPNLRVLNTRDSTTDYGLLSFIRTAAPNLTELSFNICFLSPQLLSLRREYDLTCWNLIRCNISLEPISIEKHIDCKITIQNISKEFLLDGKRIALIQTENYFRMDGINYAIDIKLNAIEHLKIFGFPIVSIGNKILIDL